MERKVNEKREELKAISKGLGVLVKEGAIDSINEGLIALYTKGEHQNFKSYRQWQAEGMQVKKGEKAFLLWAKPRGIGKVEEKADEEKEEKFFPVAYVFSNAQVEEVKGEQTND